MRTAFLPVLVSALVLARDWLTFRATDRLLDDLARLSMELDHLLYVLEDQ